MIKTIITNLFCLFKWHLFNYCYFYRFQIFLLKIPFIILSQLLLNEAFIIFQKEYLFFLCFLLLNFTTIISYLIFSIIFDFCPFLFNYFLFFSYQNVLIISNVFFNSLINQLLLFLQSLIFSFHFIFYVHFVFKPFFYFNFVQFIISFTRFLY